MSTVEFQRLTKNFGQVSALREFSLSIRSGELVTLLGPSGCGKTTTLNLLAGFLLPSSGSILVNGQAIERLPPHRRNTALVFQGYALFPHLTVARNVAFGLEIRRRPREEIRKRVTEVLGIVQLSAMADRYPRELSGGQQQRVAIARALAIAPEVLLLDEPLSNLDAELRESMRWQIRSIQKLTGITAIYVTHDQEEALSVSDRIVVMKDGAIEQVGTPQEIYSAPQTPFVASFIGAANLLPVTVRAHEGEVTRVVTEDGLVFRVATTEPPPVGAAAFLVVRPEIVRLAAAREGPDAQEVAVEEHAFLGAVHLLTLRLGKHTLRVRAPDDSMIDVGRAGSVYAHWSPGQARLVAAPPA